MKLVTAGVLVSLAHATSAMADCSAVTEELFGVKLGGPRTYLDRQPVGLSLSSQMKQDWKYGGMDFLTGTSQNIEFSQVSIVWHDAKVVYVQALVRGPSKDSFDGILHTVSKVASSDFRYEPRTDNFHLQCNDRLRVTASKGEGGRSATGPAIAMLVLIVENPLLRAEMEKAIRDQALRDQQNKERANKAR